VVRELLGTVTGLAREGVAVLMAEPALGAVRGAVDRGYVLVRGEVVATCEDGGRALDAAYQAKMGVLRTAAG
jgi:branched-chain amino acid transport system ATP-binding protein